MATAAPPFTRSTAAAGSTVHAAAFPAAPDPASTTRAASRARPVAVAVWLFVVAGLVFLMVVVGGITRLTESGLSIVRWDPVGGIVPPLSAGEWARVFADYRASPQGQLVNAGMTLAAFKGIFFWEWLHRLLGMSIGTAFALPLAAFVALRWVPRGYGWRLAALLALGGLQGAIGWWMVASGLVDRPSVAPERLAIHLVNALVLMAGCLWTALDLLGAPRAVDAAVGRHGSGAEATVIRSLRHSDAGVMREWGGRWRGAVARPTAWIVPFFVLLGVQIVWGALTAGLRAGHAADTWPLMLGHLVPPLGNPIGDPLSVQFVHRSLAYVVAIATLSVAFVTFRAGAGRRAGALASLVVLQFTLGVLTVIHGVPVALAAAHQACAAALLASAVWTAHWAVARSGVS